MLVANLDMILSNKGRTKVLMRLHRCACWSAPLFFPTLNWTNPFPVLGLLGAIIQSQESFFLYILPDPPFEYYWQVYLVHSRLQDESLQVTISKLPHGSLTCTVGDFPCTGDIQLTSRSEG